MIFKAGDKIKMLASCSDCFIGKIYTLIDNGNDLMAHDMINDIGHCSCQHKWEKVIVKPFIKSYKLTVKTK